MQDHPHLIVTAITDFGLTGPYRDYKATNAVMVAMGGMLFRSGTLDRPPLLPPGLLAYDVAGITAAFATLTALWQKRPQLIDVSVMESLLQITDWSLAGFAIEGGLDPKRDGSGPVYSIYPCRDGYVRVIVLQPAAMGGHARVARRSRRAARIRRPQRAARPADDPEDRHRPAVRRAVLEVRRRRTGRRGAAARHRDHARAAARSGARDRALPRARHVRRRPRRPDGVGLLRDRRRTRPASATRSATRDPSVRGCPRPPPGAVDLEPARPFAGLRVLDFGIGAVGVEVGRLLAENGADVIKVESRAYARLHPRRDGHRDEPIFASSSRASASFGVNVKTPEGLELMKRLVAEADVLIENSATGVMDEPGPRVVGAARDQPAAGDGEQPAHGVARVRGRTGRGYGPSTRPPSGMTYLWNWPDSEEPPGSFAVHPDHLVGRVCTVGVRRCAYRRRRAPRRVAQVETIINLLGDLLLRREHRARVGAAGRQRWHSAHQVRGRRAVGRRRR